MNKWSTIGTLSVIHLTIGYAHAVSALRPDYTAMTSNGHDLHHTDVSAFERKSQDWPPAKATSEVEQALVYSQMRKSNAIGATSSGALFFDDTKWPSRGACGWRLIWSPTRLPSFDAAALSSSFTLARLWVEREREQQEPRWRDGRGNTRNVPGP